MAPSWQRSWRCEKASDCAGIFTSKDLVHDGKLVLNVHALKKVRQQGSGWRGIENAGPCAGVAPDSIRPFCSPHAYDPAGMLERRNLAPKAVSSRFVDCMIDAPIVQQRLYFWPIDDAAAGHAVTLDLCWATHVVLVGG